MWAAFKCKNCGIEWADSDIEIDDIQKEENVIVDSYNQFEATCEDC